MIPENQRISGGLEYGTHPLPLLALDFSHPHPSVSDSFTVALPLWTPESRVAGLVTAHQDRDLGSPHGCHLEGAIPGNMRHFQPFLGSLFLSHPVSGNVYTVETQG